MSNLQQLADNNNTVAEARDTEKKLVMEKKYTAIKTAERELPIPPETENPQLYPNLQDQDTMIKNFKNNKKHWNRQSENRGFKSTITTLTCLWQS